MDSVEKYTIEEVLLTNGKYVGPTVGISMLPMLKEGRDTIVVVHKTSRLKSLDVALYKRGDAYVLHRVLRPIEGGYLIRGDNCYVNENVPEEAVIGVLTEFFRKSKHFYCTDKKYVKYVEKRLKTYKIRYFFIKIKDICKRIVKKLLKILGIRK